MTSRAGLNLEINARVAHHDLLNFRQKRLIVLAVKIDNRVVLVGRVGDRCQLRDGWMRPQLRDPMILILFGKIAVETAIRFYNIAGSIILSKRARTNISSYNIHDRE